MKIKSYAKVNLYLEVLKKRKDNYHQIITLFERISLCDEIWIIPRPDNRIRIICSHPGLPLGKTNLAWRAAELLKRGLSIKKGVDIKIDKRIPLASGLGGGSSNAASVLLGLNRLWKLNLNKKKLIFYGKKLGCDVPFFLADASFAIGAQRGDEIKALTTVKRSFWHVLAAPKIRVSTRLVYKRLDAIFRPSIIGLTKSKGDVKIFIQRLKRAGLGLVQESLFNRLESVTFGLYPEVKKLKETMADSGIGEAILMSGSGPAIFSLVSSKKEAMALYRYLSGSGKWKVFLAKTT